MIHSQAMIALLCGVLSAAPAFAQDLEIPEAVYPGLPKQALSAEVFAPAGWTVERKVSGDLNKDGVADLVLVLRENNPKNIVRHDSLGENPFDTNPRILAVAFGQRGGSGYALKLENHTLIRRRTVPTFDDPLDADGIAVERGTLRVKLGFFASAGSWLMSTTTYSFRHRNERFELIGYDHDETARNTGKTTDVSIDFLTGKRSIASGSIESDVKTTRWSNLPRRPLLTLAQIGDGVEFAPRN